MKTIKFIVLLLLMAFCFPAIAQDAPVSCENPLPEFNDAVKGKITSQIKTAYQYFMYSTDIAAGNTYEQRMSNFNDAALMTLNEFVRLRKREYRATICSYHKEDWNKPGNSSRRTLTCQPGFYLLQETLVRTTNGDWKGGPWWKENSITWKTGGHRASKTKVDIKAKYAERSIQNGITAELNFVRKELNDLGIPTSLPPFIDEI